MSCRYGIVTSGWVVSDVSVTSAKRNDADPIPTPISLSLYPYTYLYPIHNDVSVSSAKEAAVVTAPASKSTYLYPIHNDVSVSSAKEAAVVTAPASKSIPNRANSTRARGVSTSAGSTR